MNASMKVLYKYYLMSKLIAKPIIIRIAAQHGSKYLLEMGTNMDRPHYQILLEEGKEPYLLTISPSIHTISKVRDTYVY